MNDILFNEGTILVSVLNAEIITELQAQLGHVRKRLRGQLEQFLLRDATIMSDRDKVRNRLLEAIEDLGDDVRRNGVNHDGKEDVESAESRLC